VNFWFSGERNVSARFPQPMAAQLAQTGDVTPLRFSFAFSGHDECYVDFSPTTPSALYCARLPLVR
jgi:hypothetical protein